MAQTLRDAKTEIAVPKTDDGREGDESERPIVSRSEWRAPAHSTVPPALEQEVADLYRNHAESLFRYALIVSRNVSLAEDAVQETFLKYYLQRKRGEIKGERAWLFRVARNYILDERKSSGSKMSVGIEAAKATPDQGHSPERVFATTEAMQMVVQVLSPRELQCLQLRTEGFSYKEIADILGVGAGTVGSLLARGSEKIRRALGQEQMPCEAL